MEALGWLLCAVVGLNGAGLLFSPRYRVASAKVGGAVMLIGLVVVIAMALPKGYAAAAWLLGIIAPTLLGVNKNPLGEVEKRIASGQNPGDAMREVREELEGEQPQGDLFGHKSSSDE